ncbi:MAG: hybrid sensor histidine kinase/response regulator [Opitutae bacterium]|nr:hybrid sensor histidine kinase/response regulator [Opitutae bacterium]
MNDQERSPRANILIVDDTPANLELLGSLLRSLNYKVRAVTSGKNALSAMSARIPDLVLLDINMPGMDGYQVCTAIKADPAFRDIPVLFISAWDDTSNKLRAFEVGGVDFIRKPFQQEEVLARVQVHLRLRQRELDLRTANQQLLELERQRDGLTHMVVHDMRSPLTGISLGLGYLGDAIPEALADARATVVELSHAVAHLSDMTQQMLIVSQAEAGTMPLERTDCDVCSLVQEEVAAHKRTAGKQTLEVAAAGPIEACIDRPIIGRVVGNLLGNAMKFAPQAGIIRVSIEKESRTVRVSVTDNGPGIAHEHHQKIFDKFGQADLGRQKRTGVGLGLAFAKLAVEAHGGKIGVVSAPGCGSTFWFTLPQSESV